MNNDRMTIGDWAFVLLLMGCFLFIGSFGVHYQGKSEKLESQVRELKEECVLKGVATYTFDAKGNVIFSILERKNDTK